MEIVLDFGPTMRPIEVALPDERPFYEVVEAVRHAVLDEGKRQAVNILFKTKVAAQVPSHGVIVFSSTEDCLYADAQGPWWLYVQHSRRLRACAIAFEMICDVVHVNLTVDDD